MKLQASADGGGKLARCHAAHQPRVHTQQPKRPCRQPLSVPPASRVAHKPHPPSSVVAAAAATNRGQGASAPSHDNHASELSPEASKEGMYWLAAWVSSQYMGMGKSAEDALPELRRRGVVCSSASNGQVLFKVPDQEAALDGPQVIKLLRLKARPGVKLTDPPPPPGLAPSKPAPREPQSSSPSRDESPRSTSPSREYQVGRLPDSPDSLAMRWLAEWIAMRYTGFGKKAEDVLPELRRRGVVYSSIKDGRIMFRVPGVVSRVEASQIIYMLRLQPRPGVRPEEPEPPQSLMSMLAGSRMEDASPMRQASPSGSRSSSPNRYSSPSRTRASTTLSPEAAALGMRWLAIYVSSQYSGMGRSAEDALPELKAQGVVCTSVRDGRPMFVVPGHEGEVDAQDVVKILRLEVRPGVRPRAPTPPPALAGARSAPAGAPAEKPAEAPPQATIEDGFKWLASWVATNYMGMGKTVEDALPELRRRGISCSSVKGNTPMFRMPGQTTEIDGAQVIKSLRLQARPGVDPSKPSPPRGLVLGTSGAPRKPTATKPPTPSASAAAAKPSPPASAAPKPSPSASAAVATAAASAAARRASSASSKAPSTTKAPPAASSTAKAEPKAAPKAEPKTEPKAEPNPPPEKPPRPLDPDNNIILFLGQLLLPAAATLLAAVAIGGGSILWEKLTTSGVIPSRDELVKQKVTEPGSFKVGGAAPSVTVKPREPVSTPAVEPLPPPPPSPPPPPKIGVQNQGGAVSPLDAQREQELRVIQEQEQRRVQQEERERQQRFREEQEQERVAREQEARAQQLREQQQAKEQEAREQQLREERARQEREQKEREQKEKEEKEKERKEQEQREEEQKEKERKEQEQSEKEQKEKEQKEKEQKEREQREREQREREQREQERKEREQLEKEQKAREQREKEQREKEQKEREMREREQRQKEQREREQRAKEQKEREQKEKEQREKEQKEREQKEQEQREREQKEREQKEREALEKQQKERAQREREERERRQQELEQKEREDLEKQQQERARKEREQREKVRKEQEEKERIQLEKEQEQEGLKVAEQEESAQEKGAQQENKEQKEKEQKEQEQQAQEQKSQEAAAAPPVQAQGLLPQSRPSGVQPLPGALQQGGVQPQPKGGVLPKPYEPYIDPNKPRGVQPLPAQQQREGVQPAPQVEQPREEPFKWGAPRQKAEPVEEGFGDSEEDLARDLSTLATPGSKGIQQQGDGKIEGYEACIYRSYGC